MRKLALSFLLILAACGGRPSVTGKVIDNFGHPVEGATVKIENSAFHAESDSSGKYRIEFAPGSFVVTISKEGWGVVTKSLNITTNTEYPMEEVALVKPPPPGGVYLQGKDDYIPLVPRGVSSLQIGTDRWNRIVKYSAFNLSNIDHDAMTRTLEHEVSQLPDKGIVFLDSSPKKLIFAHIEGDLVASNRVWGSAQNVAWDRIDLSNTRGEGFIVRKSTLKPGAITNTMAFCFIEVGRNPEGMAVVPVSSNSQVEPHIYCLGGPRA